MTEYRLAVSREVEARLKMKCEKLSEAFVLDDNGKCELLITYIIWHCDGELLIFFGYHFDFMR